ncbi:hypothetical protein B0H14DRAFT_2359498 [Mycena olivaceomarginata]|nr:hypothetical protein B0H14DRAFT_2359498 [Mycena olivaceomarginata]
MSSYVADDLYCPACGKQFRTPGGTQSHLKQSRNCAWYRRGKNPEGRRRTMTTPSPDPPAFDDDNIPLDPIIDIPVEEIIQQWEDDLFQFIPADSTTRHLSDDDEGRFIECHPTAGQVIRMNDNLHAKWKRSFGGSALGLDGDVEMEDPDSPNVFAPFASELDWRIAEWVIKDGPGHKAFDRLLKIPGVREKLGLSYQNIRGLHQIVDSIPERAETWMTKSLSFPDRPHEKHIIRYRDPLAAIRDQNLYHRKPYRPRSRRARRQHLCLLAALYFPAANSLLSCAQTSDTDRLCFEMVVTLPRSLYIGRLETDLPNFSHDLDNLEGLSFGEISLSGSNGKIQTKVNSYLFALSSS